MFLFNFSAMLHRTSVSHLKFTVSSSFFLHFSPAPLFMLNSAFLFSLYADDCLCNLFSSLIYVFRVLSLHGDY